VHEDQQTEPRASLPLAGSSTRSLPGETTSQTQSGASSRNAVGGTAGSRDRSQPASQERECRDRASFILEFRGTCLCLRARGTALGWLSLNQRNL
jgi:hypothetical protein